MPNALYDFIIHLIKNHFIMGVFTKTDKPVQRIVLLSCCSVFIFYQGCGLYFGFPHLEISLIAPHLQALLYALLLLVNAHAIDAPWRYFFGRSWLSIAVNALSFTLCVMMINIFIFIQEEGARIELRQFLLWLLGFTAFFFVLKGSGYACERLQLYREDRRKKFKQS